MLGLDLFYSEVSYSKEIVTGINFFFFCPSYLRELEFDIETLEKVQITVLDGNISIHTIHVNIVLHSCAFHLCLIFVAIFFTLQMTLEVLSFCSRFPQRVQIDFSLNVP